MRKIRLSRPCQNYVTSYMKGCSFSVEGVKWFFTSPSQLLHGKKRLYLAMNHKWNLLSQQRNTLQVNMPFWLFASSVDAIQVVSGMQISIDCFEGLLEVPSWERFNFLLIILKRKRRNLWNVHRIVTFHISCSVRCDLCLIVKLCRSHRQFLIKVSEKNFTSKVQRHHVQSLKKT